LWAEYRSQIFGQIDLGIDKEGNLTLRRCENITIKASVSNMKWGLAVPLSWSVSIVEGENYKEIGYSVSSSDTL
jgi:hypothetical protein